jgi:L-ascorbate metabolism protein UlaG (beta-lactamase superfamily)
VLYYGLSWNEKSLKEDTMNGDMLMRWISLMAFLSVLVVSAAYAQSKFQSDVFKTSGGDLKITFIGHGTIMLHYAGKVIHVDPVSMYADYATLPKADLILVTHEHGDHMDAKAIQALGTASTTLVVNPGSAKALPNAAAMRNGDVKTFAGIQIEAVPAYNLEKAFHPKGHGNGYLLTLGDKRVFIAGDTENIPEIKALKKIDIAFLPMNQPYTMTPEQVADTAKAMRPKILYPYHFGNTDTGALISLLKDDKEIEVRIRKLE